MSWLLMLSFDTVARFSTALYIEDVLSGTGGDQLHVMVGLFWITL